MRAKSIVLLMSAAGALTCAAEDVSSRQADAGLAAEPGHQVTNVAKFSTLSGADYLAGCDFKLTGVVTLVDTNRDLLVLQDQTGAVALNFRIKGRGLEVGQLVTLDGTNCCPYHVSFPDYPYRPSGWDIRGSFEAPMNWSEYYLTRMRGFLRPQVTGNYRFWIASDNSSELWLSTSADPSRIRKIASIGRFDWVAPHEWSRFPSQHSDSIQLKAGETYYLEALQEQTTEADNLSVGWQQPLPGETAISVIDGSCLTPWSEDRSPGMAATNGILREYWTNFTAGFLEGIGGARAFESALTVREVRVHIDGRGELPNPDRIALNQRLPAAKNYRWVRTDGVVRFKAADEKGVVFELFDGQGTVRAHAGKWSEKLLQHSSNATVRVEGVCEGVYDLKGTLMPGLIWAPAENSVSIIAAATTNAFTPGLEQPAQSTTSNNPAMQGFYGIRGVVTFNDRVFGKDLAFVQADNTAMLVAFGGHPFKSRLKVGQAVDLGGALEPGKYVPVITPLVVTELGWFSMPIPIVQPLGLPDSGNREGKWNELEGVVHSVNSNGTLSIVGKDGSACLWVGQTSSNILAHYMDAKLSARGVLMSGILDAPLLLIPSRDCVDVEEEAPEHPFGMARRSISEILSQGTETWRLHRVRVSGEVTYSDAQSFFIQDREAGIRVRTSHQPPVEVGARVEVLAFPTLDDSTRALTEALVRPANLVEHVSPKDLDLGETSSFRQSGALVNVSAVLLARKTNGLNQVLELQKQQRVFVATLPIGQGLLPDILPGSRLQVVGVCDDETTASPLVREGPPSALFLTSLNILLRNPRDVVVLGGPPWWTWKRAATLVGMLVAILAGALLWVHLLHRRLGRQKAAQIVFSRRVLERLEDERRRIAVNLHDSLGQTLLVIKNQAILAIQRPPQEQTMRHRLDEISGATSQAIDEVRRITHGLRPYQLDRLGLTQAIRASVSQASENSSILFASRVEDLDGLLEKDAEIHFYRIVQEAVTNVVKHSAATEAAVVIKKRPSLVSLSIRDNGRGFNPEKPYPQTPDLGYGLSGIAERVRILGGTLVIQSRPGEGTSLMVEAPFSISTT
jgi:signal transduction histidine kinase